MLQIRTILVATDRSACAERAYAPAAEFAAHAGARVHIVHVSEFGHNPDGDATAVSWDDVAQDLRLPAGQTPPSGPVQIEEVQSILPPARALLGYAHDHDADLIVMGTSGRRGLARMFLGSVAEEIVRTAERPVLCVPCHDAPQDGPVLVPVDFSAGSHEALRHGKALAAERGAPLHVFHVVEWPSSPPPYLAKLRFPHIREILQSAQEELDRFVAGTPGPAAPTTAFVQAGGFVGGSVVEYARTVGASLLVLATHGRTGFDRLTMGSVAESVLRSASCPVLALHPGDRGLLASAGDEAEPAAALPIPSV